MLILKILLFILIISSMSLQAQKTGLASSLDSVFENYFKPGEPGGAVLVVKDNKIIYRRGFGIADMATAAPITTTTLFNLGSISKTFVAYGILKLASEQKLSLDDNLYKYFPDFSNKKIAEEIRLYHLLTHTSGIPDSRKVKEQHDFYLTAKDAENFEPLKKTDTLEFEPGTRYHYSNPAFNGLALIIEKVTGEKWQDYIRRIIFKPSGMKTSTITDGPFPQSGVSHAYIFNDKKQWEELDYGEEPTFAAAGNGGVWSNVEELWKYEQAIQSSAFLHEDWIKRSRTLYAFPGWKDKDPSRLGLSWFLTAESDLSLIGHTGSQGGFISDYVWLPEKKVFYVLLCNVPKPIKDIRASVFKWMEHHNWLD